MDVPLVGQETEENQMAGKYLQLTSRQWSASNVYLSVAQLKSRHCCKPHCHYVVVDTFEHGRQPWISLYQLVKKHL